MTHGSVFGFEILSRDTVFGGSIKNTGLWIKLYSVIFFAPRNHRICRCNLSTRSDFFVCVCFLENVSRFPQIHLFSPLSCLFLNSFTGTTHLWLSYCTMSAGIFDILNNQYRLNLQNYFFNKIRCMFFPSLEYKLEAIHWSWN